MVTKVSKAFKKKWTERRRDSSGRFAYDGGRKKKPRKGRRRLAKDTIDAAGFALAGLPDKRKGGITKGALDKARAGLLGLSQSSPTVKSSSLKDAASALDSLAPKLSQGQKARLLKASAAKKPPKVTENSGEWVKDPSKILSEDIVKIRKDRITKRSNFTIEGDRIEIWRGTKYEKYDPTFKQRRDRNFNYQVEVDGKMVSLNRQWNTFEFQGETVKGMPSLHPDLRRMPKEDLARALVSSMSQAESPKPNAPIWDPGLHGQVQGVKWTYKLGDKNGGRREGYYGEIQIHHINQWAKVDLRQLEKNYKEGKYTKEEYKRIHQEIVFEESYEQKGVEIKRKAIKVLPPEERRFVALPAGLHDAMSSLFEANHYPWVINPDTGKREKAGIPHKGKDAESGSRDWFNEQWKPKFWKQVYQREAYVLRGEAQRRIDAGDLTPQEFDSLISKVYNEIE